MIKIFINIIIMLFLITSTFGQNYSEDNLYSKKNIMLVFSLNAFHNIKIEDAQATAQILANHIKKAFNSEYNFEVITLDGVSEIEKKAKSNFDCIILTTEDYFALNKKLPLEAFATNYSDGSVGYKYYLIVNKNSNITDISQLKNETLYILAGKGQTAPTLWLGQLLKEKKLPEQKNFFKEIIIDYKATNVLLPVFFNKAKACIVTEASLNLLSELNPAIKNNIKILGSSSNILLGVCCLNSSKKDSRVYNVLKDIIPNLHDDVYGSQLLKLFNADKLVPYKEEYLQNYFNLLKH